MENRPDGRDVPAPEYPPTDGSTEGYLRVKDYFFEVVTGRLLKKGPAYWQTGIPGVQARRYLQ